VSNSAEQRGGLVEIELTSGELAQHRFAIDLGRRGRGVPRVLQSESLEQFRESLARRGVADTELARQFSHIAARDEEGAKNFLVLRVKGAVGTRGEPSGQLSAAGLASQPRDVQLRTAHWAVSWRLMQMAVRVRNHHRVPPLDGSGSFTVTFPITTSTSISAAPVPSTMSRS